MSRCGALGLRSTQPIVVARVSCASPRTLPLLTALLAARRREGRCLTHWQMAILVRETLALRRLSGLQTQTKCLLPLVRACPQIFAFLMH